MLCFCVIFMEKHENKESTSAKWKQKEKGRGDNAPPPAENASKTAVLRLRAEHVLLRKNADGLAGERMCERQLCGAELLRRNAALRGIGAGGVGRVLRVAENGPAGGKTVQPQLVRAAGDKLTFDERQAVFRLQRPIERTAGLRALQKLNMEYEINEGDGAFYGPKIDFHLEDSLGRTWQCGTVQLDFQMPLNFNLEYTDADGSKKRPIMLHRVCFGSVERFIGILIEHYAGKFPTWLAPVQVDVLPVSEKSRDYAHQVAEKLDAAGIRVKVDDRDEKIGYKIREARSIDRVPYMLILGEKEVEAGNISVRDRSGETVQRSVDEFIADITAEISERRS